MVGSQPVDIAHSDPIWSAVVEIHPPARRAGENTKKSLPSEGDLAGYCRITIDAFAHISK